MIKSLVLFLVVVSSISCAHRGYDSLVVDVPELFPGFKAENYYKVETPNNIIYVQKTLPEHQRKITEFYEEEYALKQKPSSYYFYVPKSRIPASTINFGEILDWPKIKTSISVQEKALLIN